ncbi:uncharacterized protein LY89DRAFT_152448 [Mollisia scopiformis]|uniref:Uncharacterized protein n=1 Tax=Mollisia scopiformis TaxID=149040 RepID=A0A194X2J1_MOLSC|nr:uncharacterized protein LY89DRAFT_152448 [Mollisia scopiformis]KUJ14057.1 hypothetical protein LY89DRAFT_152448 [Mollisia scopiformis]
MGLIQTSIMTGGMIYAVNKLTKTIEQRQDSNNSSKTYRDNNSQAQGYWGGPPLPRGPPYNSNEEEPRWYPADENTRAPPYSPPEYVPEKPRWKADESQPKSSSRYPSQPLQRYLQAPSEHEFAGRNNQRRISGLESLADLAIGFVDKGGSSRSGGSSRGGSSSKGRSSGTHRKKKGRK